MRGIKVMKRAMAVLVSVSMLFTMSGTPVNGASGGIGGTGSGVCAHHPKHTTDCGYVEAQPGTPCGHVHTENCYVTVENCVHEHTAECGLATDITEDGAPLYQGENPGTAGCSHVCGEDTGCITKVLDCPHERGEHDGDCGYTQGTEGSPCTFVCADCGEVEEGPQDSIFEDACPEMQGGVYAGVGFRGNGNPFFIWQ